MSHKKLKYFLPEFLIDLLRIIKKRLITFGKLGTLKSNKRFLDRYQDDSVNILANGPSLTNEVQESILGSKVIVMNDFFKSKYKDSFDIVALCYAEPKESPSHNMSNVHDILNNTNAKSYWFDISLSYKNNFKTDKEIQFICPGFEPEIFRNKKIELTKMTLSYNTTAQMAIMVAIYMGFKKISLYGFDHDWLANPQFSKHFYSSKKDETDEWGRFSYHQQIVIADRIWRIYSKLNEICIKEDIKITNRSIGSFLDVFDQENHK